MACKKILSDPLKKELLKVATEFEKDARLRHLGIMIHQQESGYGISM